MREPFERAVSPRQCAANLSLSLQLNTKGKKIEEVTGSEKESMALVETRGNKRKQLDAAARFASDQVCAVQVFLAHPFMVTRTTWKSLIGLIGILNIHEHS